MTAVLRRLDRRLLILLAAVLLVGVLVNVLDSPTKMKKVTAHFPQAVSVFKGTDVRVLGVNVGTVTAVIPEGTTVRVEMEYDAKYKVPADAKAVIVTPTLVADRFVQLTPVYKGGDVMADGADIKPKGIVPVELDRIYRSLQTLTQALGPNGVNADGTLDHLLEAGDKAFRGQGAQGNEMIQQLSKAAQTFGEGAGPLFQTITHLAEFTETLAQNDTVVRAFMQDLTGVSAMLADESDELEKAVKAVAKAVGSVKGFVTDNRDALVTDVRKLTEVMNTIVSEKDNVELAMKIAPTAMANLQMGFDHVSDSQNSRVAVGPYAQSAGDTLCAIMTLAPGMPKPLKKYVCDTLVPALVKPITSKLPWLPPEYKSYLPKMTDTKLGIRRPQNMPVTYTTGDDTTVATLLGGAQ